MRSLCARTRKKKTSEADHLPYFFLFRLSVCSLAIFRDPSLSLSRSTSFWILRLTYERDTLRTAEKSYSIYRALMKGPLDRALIFIGERARLTRQYKLSSNSYMSRFSSTGTNNVFILIYFIIRTRFRRGSYFYFYSSH